MPGRDHLPGLSISDWKNLDSHLVWIYEGVPQVRTGESPTRSSSAWMLKRGSLELEVAGERVKVRAGSWVILPPGPSWRQFSPRAHILSIHFQARWVTGHELFDFKEPRVFGPGQTEGWLASAGPMLRIVREHYPEAYHRLPDARADYAVYAELQGHFQRWMAKLWQGLREQGVEAYLPPFGGGRPLEMKRWVDAWPLHEPFRLGELAKAFSLSPTQTNRLFCGAFETTPKRYFSQRRLAYAKAALSSSSRSVKEISYASGFRHLPEFSGWFKVQTGLSPRAYRTKNQAAVD